MFTRHWIFFRFFLPFLLLAAASVPHFINSRNEIYKLLPLFLPMLIAVFNLAASSIERPELSPDPPLKKFNRAIFAWHAFEGLACLVLMAFEVAVGISLTIPDADASTRIVGFLFLTVLIFGPYALIIIAARASLARAYEILAGQILEDRTPNVQVSEDVDGEGVLQ